MTFEVWWDSTGRALFHGIGGRSLASSAFAAGAASLTADLAAVREALGEANEKLTEARRCFDEMSKLRADELHRRKCNGCGRFLENRCERCL